MNQGGCHQEPSPFRGGAGGCAHPIPFGRPFFSSLRTITKNAGFCPDLKFRRRRTCANSSRVFSASSCRNVHPRTVPVSRALGYLTRAARPRGSRPKDRASYMYRAVTSERLPRNSKRSFRNPPRAPRPTSSPPPPSRRCRTGGIAAKSSRQRGAPDASSSEDRRRTQRDVEVQTCRRQHHACPRAFAAHPVGPSTIPAATSRAGATAAPIPLCGPPGSSRARPHDRRCDGHREPRAPLTRRPNREPAHSWRRRARAWPRPA